MKRFFALLLAMTMLACAGCASQKGISAEEIPFVSRFDAETEIILSDNDIKADGKTVGTEGDVYVSHDIVYYEDKDTYESGFPYGEGTDGDKHTAEEAAGHTVLNITKSGTYRISGKLSAGQIRVDLGEDAEKDPNAVVELILDGAEVTCGVAPAVLFQNVYECDNEWTVETAKAEVDTKDAGAVLVLAEGSVNNITGSHVAKIFKDAEDEKKLWKQDGAVYSYMSMNVYGPGKLNLVADNEGLDTELHLTINGGNINIFSDNDGINTNEDGVSVTTINGGKVHIIAGLGAEGDGIDSNGYLVINGGVVVSGANPAADAGLDSDLGSYINGGIVIALGSTMDWAESDSEQVTMNLQFSEQQSSDSAIVVKDKDDKVVFAYDPSDDEIIAERIRTYSGAIISAPTLAVGAEYTVYIGGTLTGTEEGGIYDASTVTDYKDGVQQGYTGTDVMRGPGGRMPMGGGNPPQMPEGERPEWNEGEWPQRPEGEMPRGERPQMPEGEVPQWNEGERPQRPEGEMPQMPEGGTPPAPGGNMPMMGGEGGEQQTVFLMADKVNMFSGVSAVVKAGE